MAGEAGSQPGARDCSETGPTMVSLRVALRTLSICVSPLSRERVNITFVQGAKCVPGQGRGATTWWSWTGFNSVSWSKTRNAPRWKSGVGLLALCFNIISTIPSSGEPLPSVCDSLRRLLEEFRAVFLCKGVLGS